MLLKDLCCVCSGGIPYYVSDLPLSLGKKTVNSTFFQLNSWFLHQRALCSDTFACQGQKPMYQLRLDCKREHLMGDPHCSHTPVLGILSVTWGVLPFADSRLGVLHWETWQRDTEDHHHPCCFTRGTCLSTFSAVVLPPMLSQAWVTSHGHGLIAIAGV